MLKSDNDYNQNGFTVDESIDYLDSNLKFKTFNG